MPRVSEEHLSARREQILTAAWRCFARDGFHMTSMQDIFDEAGLSAGAVYRYFPGKIDLIKATAERVSQGLSSAFDQIEASEPVPRPVEALRQVMTSVLDFVSAQPVDPTRIAMHVWSEALREPQVGAVARDFGIAARARWEAIAIRWQRAGLITNSAQPGDISKFLYGAMAGFLVQRNLVGDINIDQYLSGFTALLERTQNEHWATDGASEPTG